ncbi:MAG: site-2 protease family protein [Solirubrobacterales bacterium]
MSWFLAIAGFALLGLVLHEAGHFTAAKAVGMRVERFFLFFPPKVVSIRRGDGIRNRRDPARQPS